MKSQKLHAAVVGDSYSHSYVDPMEWPRLMAWAARGGGHPNEYTSGQIFLFTKPPGRSSEVSFS